MSKKFSLTHFFFLPVTSNRIKLQILPIDFCLNILFVCKIEPVKKLKRLWESQVALLESQKSIHKANLTNQINNSNVVLAEKEETKKENSPKKWSSMQLINESANKEPAVKERRLSKGAYDTDKGEFIKPSTTQSISTTNAIQKAKPSIATISNTSIGSSIRTIEDVRSNMSFVLDEIRKRDPFKNKSHVDEKQVKSDDVKSASIENKQKKTIEEKNETKEIQLDNSNESDDDRIVHRLKQKFDKKDQRIIKVISC
jgi:hypothetical protein